jgi:GT2 family glycosyltransferase
MRMPPEVAIVVLNWNNAVDTSRCLRSLEQLDYEPYRIIVVDNGSTDDSIAALGAAHPGIPILETGQNLGYTGGNNLGIRHALGQGCDYVWLVNDDAVVAPDALSALMACATARPQAGLLGPKVYTLEHPQQFLSAGGEFVSSWWPRHRGLAELDVGQFDQVEEVDYLSGCALLASCQLVEQVGTLDDRFFAYHEDIEWCYRAKKAGFQVLFVPEARVWHPDTVSRDDLSTALTYYISRNQLIFMAKHRLGLGLIARCFATYVARIVTWSIRPKWRQKRRQRDALLWALVDFVRGRDGKARCLH